MSDSGKTVNIKGSQNIVGDQNVVTFEIHGSSIETSFLQLNLALFSPENFIPPPFTQQMVGRVQENRLIIVGGHTGIKKANIARCVAWHVKHGMSELDSEPVHVKEWWGSENATSLEAILRELKEPTILILPHLSPQNIAYNPLLLKEIALSHGHHIIACSETSAEAWQLSAAEHSLIWYELSLDDYTPQYLTAILRQKLLKEQGKLSGSLSNLDWRTRSHILDNVPIRKVANQLKTPERIVIFVDLLCQEESPDSEDIWRIIQLVEDETIALRQWYHQLNARQQLLVVALTMFNGVFDDQFFTILDILIRKAWRERDPLLAAYDYHDLVALQTVFCFVETDSGKRRIENRTSVNQQTLIEMAWRSHRRYILAALPQLAILVQGSVAGWSSNQDLYETEQKRQQIRFVIGETLSNLGLISLDDIQEVLLRLAADNHLLVQAVAAQAMASWRQHNADEKLFQTLNIWYEGAQIVELVNELIDQQRDHTQTGLAYIRSTVALTVALAATYDPPNELTTELVKQFEALLTDKNQLVRERFATHTLPRLLVQHWIQLSNKLEQMILQVDLIPSITFGLANAYRFDSESVLDQLEQWQSEAQELPVTSADELLKWREAMLITVALVYGYVLYNARLGIGPLTEEEALQKLEFLLVNAREHPYVKLTVMRIVGLTGPISDRQFNKIEPYLRTLSAEISLGKHHQIVQLLTAIYVNQRQELTGGDESVTINDVSYDVWLGRKRPLTQIEEAMYAWILQTASINVQRVAFRAFMAFASTLDEPILKEYQQTRQNDQKTEDADDLKPTKSLPLENVYLHKNFDLAKQVSKEMQQIIQDHQKTKGTKQEINIPSSHVRASSNLVVSGRFALWVVTLNRETHFKSHAEVLLPIVIEALGRNRSQILLVLKQWRIQDTVQPEAIREIADLLEKSISRLTLFPMLLGAVILLLGCLSTLFQ